MKIRAIPSSLVLSLIVIIIFVSCENSFAQDSTNYRNKYWRDSVNNYQGRLIAYQQDMYSYDWGMSFGILPVVGESYVGKTGTGIVYSAARIVALTVGVVGAVRLIESKPSFGVDIGMLVGGIAGYIGLKFSELADIRHTVSEKNEDLVDRWQIATPDIEPHSIRYPTKQWPEWVTSTPEPRHPEDARKAVDQPIQGSNQ